MSTDLYFSFLQLSNFQDQVYSLILNIFYWIWSCKIFSSWISRSCQIKSIGNSTKIFNILSASSYFGSLGPVWVFCQSIVKKNCDMLAWWYSWWTRALACLSTIICAAALKRLSPCHAFHQYCHYQAIKSHHSRHHSIKWFWQLVMIML